MTAIENKELSDQNESLSLQSNIDKQLADLEKKSNNLLSLEDQKLSSEWLQDAISELEWVERNPDDLLDDTDEKSVRWKQEKSSGWVLPPHVSDAIAKASGNEASRQGREESYKNVEIFVSSQSANTNLFGKIVNWLSS